MIFNAIIDYKAGLVVKVDGWDIDIGTVAPSGFVYTHPYCKYHDRENFSDPDIMLIKLPGISTVYLGTPRGMLYAYDGSNDTQYAVSSGMPKAAVRFPDCKTK